MTTKLTQIFIFICFLALGFNTPLAAQLKKDAQKPVKAIIKTSRDMTVSGDIESMNGDTLVLRLKNGNINFFSVKTLKSVQYFDTNGRPVTYSTEPSQTELVEETDRGKPARVFLKTSRGSTYRGNVVSLSGDTLVTRDYNKEMSFFNLKTLKSVQFFDSNGREMELLDELAYRKVSEDDVVVETQTGDVLKGRLLSRRGDTVELDIGIRKSLLIPMAQIKSIKKANTSDTQKWVAVKPYDPKAFFENPHASRGVLTQNGMPMKEGENYYQNVDGVVFHNFGIYLADNINAQIGILGIPIAGFANVNATFPITKSIVGGGGVVFWLIPRAFSMTAFGTLAVGNRDHNIGIRIGKHLKNISGNGGDLFNNDGIAYSVAAQTRTSNNWSLAFELLAFDPQDVTNLVTVGARYMRPGFACDFGLSGAGEVASRFGAREFFFGVPYVTLTFSLGGKKQRRR